MAGKFYAVITLPTPLFLFYLFLVEGGGGGVMRGLQLHLYLWLKLALCICVFVFVCVCMHPASIYKHIPSLLFALLLVISCIKSCDSFSQSHYYIYVNIYFYPRSLYSLSFHVYCIHTHTYLALSSIEVNPLSIVVTPSCCIYKASSISHHITFLILSLALSPILAFKMAAHNEMDGSTRRIFFKYTVEIEIRFQYWTVYF